MDWVFYILSFIAIIYFVLQWNKRIINYKNEKTQLNNNTTKQENKIIEPFNNYNNNNNNYNNINGNISKDLNPYCQEYITNARYITKGYYNENDTDMYGSTNPNKDKYLSNATEEEDLEVKRALHTYPLNRSDLNKASIRKYKMLKKIDNQVMSKEDYDDKYEWIDKIGQKLSIPPNFDKNTKLEELEKAQTRTLMDTITDYDEQKWNCQRIYQECGTRLHPDFALKPYSYEEYDKFLDKLLND